MQYGRSRREASGGGAGGRFWTDYGNVVSVETWSDGNCGHSEHRPLRGRKREGKKEVKNSVSDSVARVPIDLVRSTLIELPVEPPYQGSRPHTRMSESAGREVAPKWYRPSSHTTLRHTLVAQHPRERSIALMEIWLNSSPVVTPSRGDQ